MHGAGTLVQVPCSPHQNYASQRATRQHDNEAEGNIAARIPIRTSTSEPNPDRLQLRSTPVMSKFLGLWEHACLGANNEVWEAMAWKEKCCIALLWPGRHVRTLISGRILALATISFNQD